MRYSLIVVLSLFPQFVAAETVTTGSTLDAVKIFPQAALYDRKVGLDLPAGQHQILVTDLPQDLQGGQFQAFADGVTIQSIGFSTGRQVPAEPVKSDEQVAAEKALDAVKNELIVVEVTRVAAKAAVAASNLKVQYLTSLSEGKMTGGSGGGVLTADQLTDLIGVLGTEVSGAVVALETAQNELTQTNRAVNEADAKVARAHAALEATLPLKRETATAIIDLVVGADFKGDLTLIYASQNAGWQPNYEIKVGQDKANAKVNMIRQANVWQRSGEDWQGVSVTLSTSDLNRATQVSLPYPDIKYIFDPKVLRRMAQKSATMEADFGSLAEPVLEAASASGYQQYAVSLRGQTIEFELGRIAKLRGDTQGKLFRLDAIESDVELSARAAVGQNNTAVLYAELENTTGGTLLPGEATLIRDGVMVGQSYIGEVANGDTFDMALGPLNGILVEHRTLKVEDGDRGIISSYNQKIEKYEVSIRSLLDYAIDVTAYAALPVSEAEDLTVTLDTSPQPTESNIEGRRGVVGWTIPMDAGATETINYGWTLKWPEDQQLGRR